MAERKLWFNEGEIQVDHLEFDVIDSTHLYSKANKLVDLTKPNIVVAVTSKAQSNGVGGNGTQWSSPEDNIYLNISFSSAFLKGQKNLDYVYNLGKVAVCKTLLDYLPAGSDLTTVGPHSILVNGKKISGIICDYCNNTEGDLTQITIGIGVYVNIKEDEIVSKLNKNSKEFEYTSLFIQTGKEQNCNDIQQTITKHFVSML